MNIKAASFTVSEKSSNIGPDQQDQGYSDQSGIYLIEDESFRLHSFYTL